MTRTAIIRTLLRAGASAIDIRRESHLTPGAFAWRHLDRHDATLYGLPGWPTCGCASDACDAPAVTTDDGGNPVCEACVDYAIDAAGECHCAAHDARVVDAGEWTGGGMHGTPTGWVSRYVVRD